MPPKKQPKNGFWYFMVEYKQREEKYGRVFVNGFREIQSDPKCSQEWNALTSEEKQTYNSHAGKINHKNGLSMSTLLEEQKHRHMEFEAKMKVEIEEAIHVAQSCDLLPQLSFFFIHVNYFYSKELHDSSVVYNPAEIAICEFTIGEGVRRYYHQIINTTIELGYARASIEHSDSTHKLSGNSPNGEGDYLVIYQRFREFLKPYEEKSGKLPPIYTRKKFMTVVSCFFERMTSAAEIHDDTFTLYELEYVYGQLMSICNAEFPKYCNPTILAEADLAKGAFAYTPNIECSYHYKIDGTSAHCSLSIVRQWAFTICDYCCPNFNVKMLEDVHLPAIGPVSNVSALNSTLAALVVHKEDKVSILKSMTGVSEAFRREVIGRTPFEEERRRREATLKPLTIIDHSTNEKPTSFAVPPSILAEKSIRRILKPLRPPKTLLQTVNTADVIPELDSDFSSIGGRGQFAPHRNKLRRPANGRGRGGIHHD